jgi:hypothetical protein
MKNAEEILARLMEDPIIQARVKTIEDTLDTPELRSLCEFFHSLFCAEDHETDCRWYYDNELDTCWDEISHQRWMERTRTYISSEAVDKDYGELRVRLRKIFDVAMTISTFTDAEINLLDDICTPYAITVFKS